MEPSFLLPLKLIGNRLLYHFNCNSVVDLLRDYMALKLLKHGAFCLKNEGRYKKLIVKKCILEVSQSGEIEKLKGS